MERNALWLQLAVLGRSSTASSTHCRQCDRRTYAVVDGAVDALGSPYFQIQRSIRSIIRLCARKAYTVSLCGTYLPVVGCANGSRCGWPRQPPADLGRDLCIEDIGCRRPVTQVNCFVADASACYFRDWRNNAARHCFAIAELRACFDPCETLFGYGGF